jgi:hypothetical protein
LTGAGELVVLRIDLVGLHSFEGGRAFKSNFEFAVEFVNVFGHGEKFTRLDFRLEVAPLGAFFGNGELLGVCTGTGESAARSFSGSKRDDVLGGVGGRADKGPRTSTMF